MVADKILAERMMTIITGWMITGWMMAEWKMTEWKMTEWMMTEWMMTGWMMVDHSARIALCTICQPAQKGFLI